MSTTTAAVYGSENESSVLPVSTRAAQAKPVNQASVAEHLLCKSCSGVLVNAYQTSTHGCRLCQSCHKNKLHPSRRRKCPCIKRELIEEDEIMEHLTSQATCSPDIATRREVSELLFHCPNAEAGCTKQSKLRQLHAHLDEECELEFSNCSLCSSRFSKCRLSKSHNNLQSDDCCADFTAFCPLCCDKSRRLNRQQFVEHLETCPDKEMHCKYEKVGCRETRRRSEMSEHYSNADGHLELVVEKMQAQLNLLQDRVTQLSAQLDASEQKRQEMETQICQFKRKNKDLVRQNSIAGSRANTSAPQHQNDRRTLDDIENYADLKRCVRRASVPIARPFTQIELT